jgi:predicted DNA-binding protein with PD1-like motif
MPPSYSTGRSFVGRVPRGADLLEAITRIANEASIGVATVAVHGVVERLALSVLDPETRMPSPRTVEAQLEIGSLSGTVSFFKARALPRLSGVFVAHDGAIHAGTLARGTVVYACEVVITELVGAKLSRDFDPETGLALWKASSLLIAPETPEGPGDISEQDQPSIR